MPITTPNIDRLYRARRDVVEFVDVPDLGYLVVDGAGAPEGGEFSEAIQALYGVAYTAHFALRKRVGVAAKVMPLEALWWSGDQELVAFHETDPASWSWRAMIMQPEPIDTETVDSAVAELTAKHKAPAALGRVRYERWREGRSAQVMHVGPYARERPTIERLHLAITDAGYRIRGHHHEIYLGDPRRAAPERLRTIVRQPVSEPPPTP